MWLVNVCPGAVCSARTKPAHCELQKWDIARTETASTDATDATINASFRRLFPKPLFELAKTDRQIVFSGGILRDYKSEIFLSKTQRTLLRDENTMEEAFIPTERELFCRRDRVLYNVLSESHSVTVRLRRRNIRLTTDEKSFFKYKIIITVFFELNYKRYARILHLLSEKMIFARGEQLSCAYGRRSWSIQQSRSGAN